MKRKREREGGEKCPRGKFSRCSRVIIIVLYKGALPNYILWEKLTSV